MNERMWLASKETWDMLEFLKHRASQRKLRLFAVACCRRMWKWFRFEESKNAILIAEEFADSNRSATELALACAAAEEVLDLNVEEPEGAVVQVCWKNISETVLDCAGAAESFYPMEAFDPFRGDQFSEIESKKERIKQTELIRDIFGNPFRPVTIDPSWQTPAVTTLAQTIYDERRFQDMPLLASALEEAGCANEEILDHCRGPAEHVRGCWVVDLVLGKEL